MKQNNPWDSNSDRYEFENDSSRYLGYEVFLLTYLDTILMEISGYASTERARK